jgi:hypothetical protein
LVQDEWKKEDEDPFYDWKLVRKVHKSLKILREVRRAIPVDFIRFQISIRKTTSGPVSGF